MKVLADRTPIVEIYPSLTKEEKNAIKLLQSAKKFAETYLGFKTDEIYNTYSPKNKTPIWNISAVSKTSFTPYLWKYPVLGKLPYIGFYKKSDADKEVNRLLSLDYDVYIYPAIAFSSLGWFEDPIVPSMLYSSPVFLVNTVIHETSHRFLFLKKYIDFNESFASFAGDYGASLYFKDTLGDSHNFTNISLYLREDSRFFSEFITKWIKKLEEIYVNNELNVVQKLEKRQIIFKIAQNDYKTLNLKTKYYNSFAEEPLDNARLLAYRRYNSNNQLFDEVYSRCNSDLRKSILIIKSIVSKNKRSSETDPFLKIKNWLSTGNKCL